MLKSTRQRRTKCCFLLKRKEKERKGKERKGKERKGKERKGKKKGRPEHCTLILNRSSKLKIDKEISEANYVTDKLNLSEIYMFSS